MEERAGTEQRPESPPGIVAAQDVPEPPPASVARRTAVGGLCLLTVGVVLWLEAIGPARWLPAWTEGLTGVRDLVESGLLLALVVALLAAVALSEYWFMARRMGVDLPRLLLVGAGVVLVLLLWAGWAAKSGAFAVCPPQLRQPGTTATAAVCLAAFAMLSARVVQGRVGGSVTAAAMFALGLVYIPVALGFIGSIRTRWDVRGVLMFVTVCKSTDIGAYYAGKLIGGPRLAPHVSPKKTWAGAIGGTALATAVALTWGLAGLLPWLSVPHAVLYGALTGTVAILGDLAESLLKREAGVKDSGALLPGAGGMLDMVDDVLFCAPFTYLFFCFTY